jgi:NAD(P)-dependent dehydrogenase (short-subunit alcohol dehydrogenase family)
VIHRTKNKGSIVPNRTGTAAALRRRAVISGASSGVGRAAAIRFAREGWDVCLTARRAAELERLHHELAEGAHLACPGDYSDPATAERIGAEVAAKWGGLDALINCAGVYFPVHSIDTPMAEWRPAFQVMVDGALYLSRMAVPLMTGGGRIVHITSIHAERAEALASGYAMAKAAINQLCRVLALELAPQGILVNAVAPGFIDTPMAVIDGVNELESDWFKRNYVLGHHLPLRRAAQPEEIAGVAFFLAGPDASYITGQVITVDGGLTITF